MQEEKVFLCEGKVMKKYLLAALLFITPGAYAQTSITLKVRDDSSYSYPMTLFGVNSERMYENVMDQNGNFYSGFTDLYKALPIYSLYFGGGSVGRLYHYSATSGKGYGVIYNEETCITTDNGYKLKKESHDISAEDSTYPGDIKAFETHIKLCKMAGSSKPGLTFNVNMYNGVHDVPSSPEYNNLLNYARGQKARIDFAVMGTELDNSSDEDIYWRTANGSCSAMIPGSASQLDGYQRDLSGDNSVTSGLSSYKTAHHLQYGIAGDATQSNSSSWNQTVGGLLGNGAIGALNLWWNPVADNYNGSEPAALSDYNNWFANNLTKASGQYFATESKYFDHIIIPQYGIKGNSTGTDDANVTALANTLLSEMFVLRYIFTLIELNDAEYSNVPDFFEGAYLYNLESNIGNITSNNGSNVTSLILGDVNNSPQSFTTNSTYNAFSNFGYLLNKDYWPVNGMPSGVQAYYFNLKPSVKPAFGTIVSVMIILNPNPISYSLSSLNLYSNNLQLGCYFTVTETKTATLLTVPNLQSTTSTNKFLSTCISATNPLMIDPRSIMVLKWPFGAARQLSDEADSIDVKISPVPAIKRMNIYWEGNNVAGVSLINSLGQEFKRINVRGHSSCVMNINGLSAGIYFVKIQMLDGTIKFIKVAIAND